MKRRFLYPHYCKTNRLNRFSYTQFGTEGTRIDSVGTFFSDNNEIDSLDYLRSGATGEANMHFLYDGDGYYYIEFDNIIGDSIEVRIPITK